MNFITKVKEKKQERSKEKKQADSLLYSHDLFVERRRLNPLIKLFVIIKKNIKLLIRSKTSALIFILGPLLITFLIALSFNTSTLFDLNVAVHSESYSTLSNGIIENLSDSQYNVIKLETQEECIDAVKFGDFQVCLIFPANMVLDNSANNIVEIYVDNSRLNIANLIANQITSKVSIESSEISEELITEMLIALDNSNQAAVQSLSLITELQNSNTNLQTNANTIATTLQGIDLSYTNLDTTAIDSEMTNLQTTHNLSSSDFTTLTTLIDTLESDYTTATTSLENAGTGISGAETTSTETTTTLTTDATKLQTINQDLSAVTEEINNIKITNVESIASPVRTSIEQLSSANSYLLYILPTILIMLMMFVSLLMSSSAIISEKTSRAYFRNFITPSNSSLFMLGEYLSNLIILLFQTTIILLVLLYFFTDLGSQTFILAGAVMLATGSFFIFLGMLIGYLFNTKQTVTLAAISSGLIMLFFSNTILPLETLSSATRKLIFYNPFILGESMLKKILLFNADFAGVSQLFFILLGLCLAVLVGAILARRFSKKFLSN